MKNALLTGVLVVLTMAWTQAQHIDFGLTAQPEDTEAIDDLIYYGESMDLSGGYIEGEYVGDFTIYDFEGNSLNLYETLQNGKPTIMVSGSVSCIRFTNAFHPVTATAPAYNTLSNFIEGYQDAFNWIFVYGVEAHPTEGECPSNCPPGSFNDTTVVQHETYLYRRFALGDWLDSPAHDFPFNMYADNPDNAVYNNFFQRPFGALVLNCEGEVVMRGDWLHIFVNTYHSDLVALLEEDMVCEVPVEEEEEEDSAEEDPIDEDDDLADEEEDESPEEGDDDLGDGTPGEDDGVVNVAEQFFFDGISIYPNPAKHFTTVEVPEHLLSSAILMRLYDQHGQVAFEQRLTGTINMIGIDRIAQGVYVLEIINFEGQRHISRFMKT